MLLSCFKKWCLLSTGTFLRLGERKRAWACACTKRFKTSPLKTIRSDDSAQVKLPIPLSYLPKLASHFHLGPLKEDSWTREIYFLVLYTKAIAQFLTLSAGLETAVLKSVSLLTFFALTLPSLGRVEEEINKISPHLTPKVAPLLIGQCGPVLRSAVLSEKNWPYERADLISGLLTTWHETIMIGTGQKLTLYPKTLYPWTI